MTCIYEIYVANTDTRTRTACVCLMLNKMATMVIDKFHSQRGSLYPVISSFYSLPSTLFPILSTLYSLPCTLYPLLSSLFFLLSTLFSVLSTLYSLYSLPPSLFCYCPANGRHFAYTLKEIDDALKKSPPRRRISNHPLSLLETS